MSTKLPPPGDPNAVYVLDVSGYVFRAYHAITTPMSTSRGEPTHAVFGVANMLNKMVRERNPQYLAVAMDSKTENSVRRKIFPEYKATRPAPPPDLAQQIVRCRELVELYEMPVLYTEGYEADDLIAGCVREARFHGLTTVICTADKDMMQLVAPDVIMWDAMRDKVYGVEEVREKWGVGPEGVCDLLALMGDTSDNVPGVTGIGEKTAARLIAEYGSIDGVYKSLDKLKGKLKENLVRDEPNARLSYRLVCLTLDIPHTFDLDQLRYGGWDPAKVKSWYAEMEFTRLANSIDLSVRPTGTMRAPGSSGAVAPRPGPTVPEKAPVSPTTVSAPPVPTASAPNISAPQDRDGSDAETTEIPSGAPSPAPSNWLVDEPASAPQKSVARTAVPPQQQLDFGARMQTATAPASSAVTRAETQTALTTAATDARSYETVLTVEALDAAIAACRAAGVFALDSETTTIDAPRADLLGISLAWKPGHGVYVPIGHRVLGDPTQLRQPLVLDRLRPLFADAKVRKVGHDIKFDEVVLRRAGVPVEGYDFDTMIASYLIDAERHSHLLDEIARAELNYDTLSYDVVTRKERGKQLPFEDVDIATATRYAAEKADITLVLSERLRPRLKDAELGKLMDDVEIPLSHVLARMEARGVLVDVQQLKSISDDVAIELQRLEKELHAIVGREFNVKSPRELEAILFDELQLPVIKRTRTGRSTDHQVLEELAEHHPLPAKIVEHRVLQKLQGTYLEALPLLVNPSTGRIHTSYAQAVAATGRLSSNNPNLQNIPIRTEVGRKIRLAFVAPKGFKIFAADYSQIELRVLAHLSQDPILIDAFRKNEDIHTRTAMEIFKVPASGVDKNMRAKAKTTNFAVLYGQGENALARQLGIDKSEAGKFIKSYFRTFSGLTKFLDDTIATARAGQGVRTLLGRRRFVPAINSQNRGLRGQAERIAKNTPIQGTAADIMKLAMVAVARRIDELALQSRMVLTVHDELVFEAAEGEEVALESLARETMAGVMKLDVPLVVDVGWGRNWGEAH